MKRNRIYGCKDVYMLLAAEMIAENLKANLDVLSNAREQWTEQYADDLIARIHYAMSKYLSNDSQKILRNSTIKLKSTMQKAIKSITFFKTQLCIDLKNEEAEKYEILETLGFNKFYKKTLSKNQNALLQLLLTFKENLTEDIRSQLTSKGFKQAELDKICDLVDVYKNVNLYHENIKTNKKQFSQEKRIALNAIGYEIKGICKLASMKIDNNPALKNIFIFSKVVTQIAKTPKAKIENNDDEAINENQENITQ